MRQTQTDEKCHKHHQCKCPRDPLRYCCCGVCSERFIALSRKDTTLPKNTTGCGSRFHRNSGSPSIPVNQPKRSAEEKEDQTCFFSADANLSNSKSSLHNPKPQTVRPVRKRPYQNMLCSFRASESFIPSSASNSIKRARICHQALDRSEEISSACFKDCDFNLRLSCPISSPDQTEPVQSDFECRTRYAPWPKRVRTSDLQYLLALTRKSPVASPASPKNFPK